MEQLAHKELQIIKNSPISTETFSKFRSIAVKNQRLLASDYVHTLSGIFWMLLAMLLKVSMHTCAKYLAKDYPVVEVVWARYFFHLILIVLIFWPKRDLLIKTGKLKIQLIRASMVIFMTVLYFLGLKFIQMGQSNAIQMTSPLIVTLLSGLMLHEKVKFIQWMSISFGCFGALIIIQPGTDIFQIAALLPLCGAVCFALFKIYTRLLGQTESSLSTLFYPAACGSIFMSCFVPFFWVTPSKEGWFLFVLIGLLGGTFHFAFIKSLTAIPAFLATTFTYTQLLWSLLLGYFIFSEVPGLETIIGGLIITVSGVISAFIHLPKN